MTFLPLTAGGYYLNYWCVMWPTGIRGSYINSFSPVPGLILPSCRIYFIKELVLCKGDNLKGLFFPLCPFPPHFFSFSIPWIPPPFLFFDFLSALLLLCSQAVHPSSRLPSVSKLNSVCPPQSLSSLVNTKTMHRICRLKQKIPPPFTCAEDHDSQRVGENDE